MPRPKSAKTERTCLVCGGTTNVAHLGLDICRACTVFYRRSRDRKFACRSNTNNCPIGEGVNCRKCRLAEMERMLSEQPVKARVVKVERTSPNSPEEDSREEEEEESDRADHNESDQTDNHDLFCSPSTSAASVQPSSQAPSCQCENEKPTPRALLEKLRSSYRAMCETRLAGELAARKDPPHPLSVVDGKFAIVPATYGGMEYANRMFLTALLQFGTSAFPEFGQFEGKHRWTIVTNFFARYRMFEVSYRSDKAFDVDMNKTFAGYTMYWAEDTPKHFFDDCPNDGAFREEARSVMEERFKSEQHSTSCRKYMRRTSLRHDEFLAVLAVMFWSTEGLEVSEEVTRTSQFYKEKIMKELHVYYREELQLNEYASRLGELLMLLQVYEAKSVGLDQHFEVMRLLNVFSDNTLVYRLAS